MSTLPFPYDLMAITAQFGGAIGRDDDADYARVLVRAGGTEHVTAARISGRGIEHAQREAEDAMIALLTRELVIACGYTGKEQHA